MNVVKFICINPNQKLTPATAGSNAIDLVANIKVPVPIYPGAPATLIQTGLRVDMTGVPGLCALVLPRSGLGHKHGLVLGNGIGLIDNDYQGEIMVSAWNRNPALVMHGMGIAQNSKDVITINPGDRIAQLLFLDLSALSQLAFEQVEEFVASERGESGFGSTGVVSKSAKRGSK